MPLLLGVIVIRLALCLAALVFPATAHAGLIFQADLDGPQVVPPTASTATGTAVLTLNEAGTELSYTIQLFGLDLEPIPANRVDANDVTKIHIHLGAPGSNGPHTLNIFGLPSEDDGDLVVDYVNEVLSGVWDDSDAGPGPYTPGDTKPLTSFLPELLAGDLYIQIHTVGLPSPGEIRGQILPVPEPASLALWGLASICGAVALRRKRKAA